MCLNLGIPILNIFFKQNSETILGSSFHFPCPAFLLSRFIFFLFFFFFSRFIFFLYPTVYMDFLLLLFFFTLIALLKGMSLYETLNFCQH